jgi:hypothetical protein
MDLVIKTLSILLIALAAGPLLLLGLALLCNALGWTIGDRLLSAMVHLLSLQWRVGAIINVIVGVALAGLGLWMTWHMHALVPRLAGGLLLIPFGLWRAYRGAALYIEAFGPSAKQVNRSE